MITIERLEITNIRSIGHAVVEPLTDGGVTALNGPNGSGKSSTLVALTWALYGVTPDGVPQPGIRRQGSTGECKVVVTFRHDGQTVVVERGLKGTRDAAYARIVVDGQEQTLARVSAAADWIVTRLGGLDAEAFVTAFVVRQKELDGLVKARPAERRRLIERLAGIDRMSEALAAARDDERDVRRRLDMLPGDPDALTAAAAALEAAQVHAATMWDRWQTASQQCDEARAVLSETQQASERLAERLRAYRDAHDQAVTAEREAALADQAADQAAAEVTRLTREAAGGSPAALADARADYDAAQQAVTRNRDIRAAAAAAVAEADREHARATAARDRAARAAEAAAAAQAAAAQASARAAEINPADVDTQAAAAAARAETLTEQVGALRGEYDRLAKAVTALSHASDPSCPTCTTVLTDPQGLIDTLTAHMRQVAEAGRRYKSDAETAAGEAARLRRAAEAARQARRDADQAADYATRLAAEAAVADADAAAAARQADDLHRQAAAARTAAADAETVADALAAAFETAASRLRAVETAADAAARIPAARTAAAAAHARARAARDAAAAAAAAVTATAVPDVERQQIETAYRVAQDTVRNAERVAAETHGEFRLAEQQVTVAERTRDSEAARLRLRADTVAELERKTAVREALDGFRRDRIGRLAPELSEVATDLVTRMTGGRYVQVRLDEEFTPILTDADGETRPAAWLSGGEESAVALALRVAIGELIAGSRGGVLFLDEVLTAQDAVRRQAVMAAIRDLPARQVIVINHVSEATDMVDLVLDVVVDPTAGATIVPARAGRPVDEATLDRIDALT